MTNQVAELAHVIQLRYQAVGLDPRQSLAILSSTENYEPLVDAYYSAAVALGADPVLLTYQARIAGSGLPDVIVEMASRAHQIVDLCLKTWGYTDSLAKHRSLLKERGGRRIDSQTFGWERDVNNIINCPPSPQVTERVQRVQAVIDSAKMIRVTSDLGTDFSVKRGNPNERASFTGRIPAEVAFPPPEDSAEGVIYFVGGFLTQFPTHVSRMVYQPVRMEFAGGKLVQIARDTEAGIMLDQWFASHQDPASYQFAHFDLGLDHRIALEHLDSNAIHYKYGSVVIGLGSNWDPLLWGGGVKAQSHIDMSLVGANCWVDGKCILKNGELV